MSSEQLRKTFGSTSEESWLSACHLRGVGRRSLKGVAFTEIVLNFLFLLLPLIYIPNIFNPYEFPKFVVFVCMVSLLLLFNVRRFWSRSSHACQAGELLRFAQSAPQNDGKFVAPKLDLLAPLILIYGLIVYLADLFGIDPKTSFLGSQIRHQGFITLLAGIGLFFLVRYNHYKNYKHYVRGILVGAFFVCVFALWQAVVFYLFKDPTIPTYQGRIIGTLGNPNSLAGYLVMVLPFVLFINRHSGKRSASRMTSLIIRVVLVIMILATILFTDSRSAFLAVTIILLVYFVNLFMKIPFPKVILALVLILIFWKGVELTIPFISKNLNFDQPFILKDEERCFENWPNAYPLKIITDIRKTSNIFFTRDSPCDSRFLIWVAGLNSLNNRPILGFGQENFELLIPQSQTYSVDNAHNIFLETATSSGVIGLLIFLGIIIIAFRKANFTIRMALLSFLIVAQFNPLSIVEISLFWFLLALDSKHLYM